MIVLALGAFAFTSCDDKDDIDNVRGNGNEAKVLSLAEQQAAITQALTDVANKLDFSDLGAAIGPISHFFSGNYKVNYSQCILKAFSDSTLLKTIFSAIAEAAEDTVSYDYESLYLNIGASVSDSVSVRNVVVNEQNTVVRDSLLVLSLDTIYSYNHDCLQLNVTYGSNLYVLKVKAEQSEVYVITESSKGDIKGVCLPSVVDLSLSCNDNQILSFHGKIESGYNVFLTMKDKKLTFNGDSLAISGALRISNIAMDMKLTYNETDGSAFSYNAMIADSDVLSITTKLGGSFAGYSQIDDYTEKEDLLGNLVRLDGLDMNASLNGGAVKLLAKVDNPFKDAILAEYLDSLIENRGEYAVPAEKRDSLIARMNAKVKAEFYFKDYTKPQAWTVFTFDENREGDAKDYLCVFIGTYDEKGRVQVIPWDLYFEGVDIDSVLSILISKVGAGFGSSLEDLMPLVQMITEMFF